MNPSSNSPFAKTLIRGLSLISIPVCASMPTAIVLYFVTSNLITAATQYLWHFAPIRALFRIATPIKHQVTTNSAAAGAGFMENFKNAYKLASNQSATTNAASYPNKQQEKVMRKSLSKNIL